MFQPHFVQTNPIWWQGYTPPDLEGLPLFEVNLTGSLGGGDRPQAMNTFRGEDITIRVAMSPAVNISGWNFRFDLRPSDDLETVALSETTGFTIDSASGGTFHKVINANATSGLNGSLIYQFEIWRVDAGQQYVLAWGDARLRV